MFTGGSVSVARARIGTLWKIYERVLVSSTTREERKRYSWQSARACRVWRSGSLRRRRSSSRHVVGPPSVDDDDDDDDDDDEDNSRYM